MANTRMWSAIGNAGGDISKFLQNEVERRYRRQKDEEDLERLKKERERLEAKDGYEQQRHEREWNAKQAEAAEKARLAAEAREREELFYRDMEGKELTPEAIDAAAIANRVAGSAPYNALRGNYHKDGKLGAEQDRVDLSRDRNAINQQRADVYMSATNAKLNAAETQKANEEAFRDALFNNERKADAIFTYSDDEAMNISGLAARLGVSDGPTYKSYIAEYHKRKGEAEAVRSHKAREGIGWTNAKTAKEKAEASGSKKPKPNMSQEQINAKIALFEKENAEAQAEINKLIGEKKRRKLSANEDTNLSILKNQILKNNDEIRKLKREREETAPAPIDGYNDF